MSIVDLLPINGLVSGLISGTYIEMMYMFTYMYIQYMTTCICTLEKSKTSSTLVGTLEGVDVAVGGAMLEDLVKGELVDVVNGEGTGVDEVTVLEAVLLS